MQYLVVDAEIDGTGLKDQYEGQWIDPSLMPLSASLVDRLAAWRKAYELEHFAGFEDPQKVAALDEQGRTLAKAIRSELGDVKVEYYSDARGVKELI